MGGKRNSSIVRRDVVLSIRERPARRIYAIPVPQGMEWYFA